MMTGNQIVLIERDANGNEQPRRLIDIRRDLEAVLDQQGLVPDEYFTVATNVDRNTATWPTRYTWLACYAVTGGSEGHYVHVDVIGADGSRTMLFLGKTFQGMEFAYRCAAACAVALWA